MKENMIAFFGLLVVDKNLNACICEGNKKIQIIDPIFLEFIQNKAPFIYEVEGGTAIPPLFSFLSTVIASHAEIDGDCIAEIIYCASSSESRMESVWADWVAFEYHRFMPNTENEYQTFKSEKTDDGENIQGILVFRSEFEKPFLEQALIASLQNDGLFKTEFNFGKDACRTMLSFLLHSDRGISRVSFNFKNDKTLFAKDFFDRLDGTFGKNIVQLFESYKYNKYGYVPIEMECQFLPTNESKEIAKIKKILIKKESYVLRWQEHAPATLKSFFEGKYIQAPLMEIPYCAGGSGYFHVWLN